MNQSTGLQRIKRLLKKGQLSEALNEVYELEKSENLSAAERYKLKKIKVTIWSKFGRHWKTDDLDPALKDYQKNLAMYRKMEDVEGTASALANIALIYQLKGDLDNALKFFQECLALDEKTGNPLQITTSLNEIGQTFFLKNDLKRALEYFHRSVPLLRENSYAKIEGATLRKIGIIYHKMNDRKNALESLKQSLFLERKIENDLQISETLFHLILVYLDCDLFDQAFEYLEELKQIVPKATQNIINQRFKVVNALVLKNSKRITQKAKAQEILQQVIKEEIMEHELSLLAMFNLSELLLEEFQFYGEVDVFTQIKALISEINDIALHQGSPQIIIQSLLLKAKLELIEGKAKEADDLLESARRTAEDGNLPYLRKKIISEQENVRGELEKWTNLIQMNVSLKERIEQANLQDYIAKAVNSSKSWLSD